MNLPLKLAEVSRVHPKKEAIVYHQERMNYEELNKKTNQLAIKLQQLGISPQDRVLVALNNSPEFVIAYYAILRIKGIVVPVNPAFTRNEISSIVKDCLPKMAIITPELIDDFMEISSKINSPELLIFTDNSNPEKRESESNGIEIYSFESILAGQQKAKPPVLSYDKDDPAAILYTSGPSTTPKGAVLTHNNLYSNALTFSEICKMTSQDRLLLVAPVYHIAAQTCVMHNAIVSAATLVIHDGWTGAETVLHSIEQERITFFFGPPTMYSFLVGYPEADKYDTSSLRIAYSGAAALPREVFDEFYEKFGIQITEGYGLSETSPVVTSNPIEGPKKVGSIGKPVPGVEVRIFDYEAREVPQGQVGEIVVRGPNVMAGYYNKEDETRWVMRNGWFHTSDLAYIDEDGYLFIVDRKKDIIIRGGININSKEVEEIISTHPSVYDVAVVSVPDAVMGEEIMAFVLLREGNKTTASEIQEFCRQKLAKYKIPKYIRFVEDLPKTTSGKLMRREVQNWINKQ